MRDFDLSKEGTITESFRTADGQWHAGAFDYEVRFYHPGDDEMDELCEWLAENCSENFIVAEDASQILAGGFSDNKLGWANRHQHKREIIREIRVRLMRTDQILFRLTWVL